MFFDFKDSPIAELAIWLLISWVLLAILGHNFVSVTLLTILCFVTAMRVKL
jgi:hypothetical protein